MNDNTVVISRYWHNPEVNVTLNLEGIKIVVSLDDFCWALAHETGQQAGEIQAAKDRILAKLKEASIHA